MDGLSAEPTFRTRALISASLRALQPRLEAKGVRHVGVFGSIARGDDRPESDVDLVLDLDPNAHVSLIDLGSIYLMLTEAFGRSVDLVTSRTLRPERHSDILDDLYEVF